MVAGLLGKQIGPERVWGSTPPLSAKEGTAQGGNQVRTLGWPQGQAFDSSTFRQWRANRLGSWGCLLSKPDPQGSVDRDHCSPPNLRTPLPLGERTPL